MDFHLCTREGKNRTNTKLSLLRGKAKYYRKDGDIDTLTEIVFAPGKMLRLEVLLWQITDRKAV